MNQFPKTNKIYNKNRNTLHNPVNLKNINTNQRNHRNQRKIIFKAETIIAYCKRTEENLKTKEILNGKRHLTNQETEIIEAISKRRP